MLNPPPPRPKNAIFEDEEKSKVSLPSPLSPPSPYLNLWCFTEGLTSLPLAVQMLSRLLTSTHPDDLKAANKLIKEMVLEVSSPPSG